MARVFLSIDRLLTRAAMGTACASLALASLIGFAQVLARFVIQEPLTWSEPATRILLIWMTFLGMVGAFRHGTLISVEMLHRMSSGRARALLDLLIGLGTVIFLGVLFYFGLRMLGVVRFQNLAGLEISIAYGYSAIPIGAACSIVAVIANTLDPQPEEPPHVES